MSNPQSFYRGGRHEGLTRPARWSVGPANANQVFSDDDHTAREVVEVVVMRQLLEDRDDVGRLLIV